MLVVGSLGAVAALLVERGAGIEAQTLILGIAAGLTTAIGLTAVYRALAIGPMSVVAPISATGVLIPVIVGIASGDHPSPAQGLGIVLAIVGMLVVVRESSETAPADATESRSLAIALAAASALGLGAYYLTVDGVQEGQTSWFLLVGQLSAAVVLAVVIVARHLALPSRADRLKITYLGAQSFAAWAQTTAAFNAGHLSLTATIISMYPLVTVVLAVRVTHEALTRLQAVGLVAAFVGIALIAV
jgi:drug/metabolite transporter (DMT)-like permease